jgi:hypothetical protein
MEIKSQKNGISQLNLSLSLFGILCIVHLTKWVVFFPQLRDQGIKIWANWSRKWFNVVKTKINYPFGNGLYMFIPPNYGDLEDGVLCFNHITSLQTVRVLQYWYWIYWIYSLWVPCHELFNMLEGWDCVRFPWHVPICCWLLVNLQFCQLNPLSGVGRDEIIMVNPMQWSDWPTIWRALVCHWAYHITHETHICTSKLKQLYKSL